MEWFNGGVLNAITTCREKQALFIVYITDDSTASVSTSEVWNCEEVMEVLKNKKFVALRISKDSAEFNQFSQFFAVFVFPSVYCIDLSGKPLVVMSGQQTAENLKVKLSEAFGKLLPSSGSFTSEANLENTPNPVQTTFSPTESSSESTEEKKKRCEEKIKQKRQERIETDKQREKDKEKDRREQGRNVAKFKEMQAELQNKSWMMERQKQKEDATLAREEVRAKLEQDRREREDRQRSAVTLRQRNQEETASKSAHQPLSSKHSGMARIQLRLPMGSTRVVEVNCDDSLDSLRQKVSEVLDAAVTSFSLIRLYPRQELNSDMDSQSMSELKLVPTGVIIVKMDKILSTTGGDNIFWATLMSTVNFIIWIFSITKKFALNLFSSTSTSAPRDESSSTNRHDSEKRFRKFRQDDSSEEDSGTYNGNSTQQQ